MRTISAPICATALVALAMPAMAEEFTVGFAVSLSGYLAPYDAPTLEGAQLAIKDMNAGGGIAGKMPVAAIVKDVRSETAATQIAVQELLDAGADVIVVPCDDDPAIAGGLLAQAAQVPVFSTCATNASLPATVGDYYFANYLSDTLEGAALAQYAGEQGYKTAYLLLSPDTTYTNNLPQYFATAFAAVGGQTLGSGTYKFGQQDFSAEVTRIKALPQLPDVIVTAAYEPDFPSFIKQLRGQGLMMPVLGADGLDSPTTLSLGEAGEGVVFVNAGNPGNNPRLAAFAERYQAETGTALNNGFVATGYDLMLVLQAGLAAAGSAEGPALRDALDAIEGLEVTTGTVSFQGNDRIPERSITVNRVEGGAAKAVATYTIDRAALPAPL